MSLTSKSNTANILGPQLRAWRGSRGKSQLALSLDTGISQRQISFIESGRSTPGRHNLLHIADALDVPFRERNALLLVAGYAPIYSEASLDNSEMKGVTEALTRMLRQQRTLSSDCDGPLLECRDDKRGNPAFFQLLHRLVKAPRTQKSPAPDVRSDRYATVYHRLGTNGQKPVGQSRSGIRWQGCGPPDAGTYREPASLS